MSADRLVIDSVITSILVNGAMMQTLNDANDILTNAKTSIGNKFLHDADPDVQTLIDGIHDNDSLDKAVDAINGDAKKYDFIHWSYDAFNELNSKIQKYWHTDDPKHSTANYLTEFQENEKVFDEKVSNVKSGIDNLLKEITAALTMAEQGADPLKSVADNVSSTLSSGAGNQQSISA